MRMMEMMVILTLFSVFTTQFQLWILVDGGIDLQDS